MRVQSSARLVCYEPDVFLIDIKPVHVLIRRRDECDLDAKTVMSHITKRSSMIIINSPNNPTGNALSYDDLPKLSKLAVERDLIVISNQVYEKIIYDDAKHLCLATFQKCWKDHCC